MDVVFPPLIMGLIERSRSCFKQYRNCLLIPLLHVEGCFINFWVSFGYTWEGIVFLNGLVKLGEIRNLGDLM